MPPISKGTRQGLAIAAMVAVAFAIYGAVEGVLRGSHGSLVSVVASFACIGLLFGAIVAFDASPKDKHANRPDIRLLLSALAGLCLGLVWGYSTEGVALCTLVFAILGYLGKAWAKYL